MILGSADGGPRYWGQMMEGQAEAGAARTQCEAGHKGAALSGLGR